MSMYDHYEGIMRSCLDSSLFLGWQKSLLKEGRQRIEVVLLARMGIAVG